MCEQPEFYFGSAIIPPYKLEDIINELIVGTTELYCYDSPFMCPWCSHQKGFSPDDCKGCRFEVSMNMYERGRRRIQNALQRLNEIQDNNLYRLACELPKYYPKLKIRELAAQNLRSLINKRLKEEKENKNHDSLLGTSENEEANRTSPRTESECRKEE